jgi:hypothetical protein
MTGRRVGRAEGGREMNDLKWQRYGAAAGVLFVILLLVGGFIAGSAPGYEDSPREIASTSSTTTRP